MAATATAKAQAPTSSLMASMNTEDKVVLPTRGRSVDPDVIAIREQLDACIKDEKGRSFSGVTDETKEVLARKVRAAGKLKGHTEIEVATRFDKDSGKLFWGPKVVMDKLAGRS